MRTAGIFRPLRRGAALLTAAAALGCVCLRASPALPLLPAGAALASAALALPGGGAALFWEAPAGDPAAEEPAPEPPVSGPSGAEGDASSAPAPAAPSSAPSTPSSAPAPASSAPASSAPAGDAAEAEVSGTPVQEVQIGGSGQEYQGIYVKNSNQNTEIDIAEELAKRPDVQIETGGEPQVLLYHTHTTESYLLWEQEVFPAGGATRSQDNTQNVVLVGEAIAAQLRAAGIGVVHDTTCHDYPSYNGSYTRSAATIEKNLEQYPSIQVTIDVHRDALGDGTVRKKPTAVIGGKKAAQVMILTGCDDDGTLGFPDWEYNLRLALRVQQALVQKYPGLARPVQFGPTLYNLNRTHGSLLVEFGTEVNTLDEALYAGELFGRALAEVLLSLQAQEG